MTRGDLVQKLIASFGQEHNFKATAESLIREEKRKGNHRFALVLEKTLEQTLSDAKAPKRAKGLQPLTPLADGGKAFSERIEPEYAKKDIFLSMENMNALFSLQNEFEHSDLLKRHGLTIRSKVLFCGPPGSGKTMCAHVFASELRLPLFQVQIDKIISSYLGETASNLREVFEFAQKQPCVVFLDEFDSLARSRTNDDEHNELRRVVNNLLVFIDRAVPKGFIVAATNFEDALDPAIWRRFDEILWFDWPSPNQIAKFLDNRFKNFETRFRPREFASDFDGKSFADIDRICISAMKYALLDHRRVVAEGDMSKAINNERRRKR